MMIMMTNFFLPLFDWISKSFYRAIHSLDLPGHHSQSTFRPPIKAMPCYFPILIGFAITAEQTITPCLTFLFVCSGSGFFKIIRNSNPDVHCYYYYYYYYYCLFRLPSYWKNLIETPSKDCVSLKANPIAMNCFLLVGTGMIFKLWSWPIAAEISSLHVRISEIFY